MRVRGAGAPGSAGNCSVQGNVGNGQPGQPPVDFVAVVEGEETTGTDGTATADGVGVGGGAATLAMASSLGRRASFQAVAVGFNRIIAPIVVRASGR